ncbi:ABC transporter permease [Marinifilum caeruleilacunae]|uniref:ABC transporter permease n=1 Tax=Marinifilum caeruleilacunae TaxID=2499076 RepID=A0ABX1WSC6_9BACT|nr:ABC transporter permease [Marinifilum caeruleilacunae]NOU59005.1 ABC transporter permease [Marinifilum caeruleilacunae]
MKSNGIYTFIQTHISPQALNKYNMFLYKLKLAIRSLAKDKLNSFINIFGLAVGMAAVILISVFIQYELSYDKFNSKFDRTYRLISQLGMETADDYSINRRLNHEKFKENIPGLEEITQLQRGWQCEIIKENKRFYNFTVRFADDNFHKVFDLDYIHGNPNTALVDITNIVLSEKTAKTIFGRTDVVGEQLIVEGQDCTISGVAKNTPGNSQFDFDVLAPLEIMYPIDSKSGLEFFTYAVVKEGVDTEITLKNILSEYRKIIDGFQESGYKTGAYFQKLGEVHLHSKKLHSITPSGNIEMVLMYTFLAALILIIAMINFINIMTVQYEGKIKEIGMRKAIGATRWELIKLFVGKSILLTSIALILGVVLAEIFLPHFKNLVHRDLAMDYANNIWLSIGLPVLAVLVGIISGTYPAIFISKPTPSAALQGGLSKTNGRNALTKFLVVFQFTVSLALISTLYILNKQINYMRMADLGFNPEKVIAIGNINSKLSKSYYAIKDELLKSPVIQHVSASDHMPGGAASGESFSVLGQDEDKVKPFSSYRVQPDYFKTVGIELTQGKSFKETGNFNQKGIIINEAGVKFLNVDNVIGLNVEYHGEVQEIIGVVKDFNYSSLRSKIKPLMFSHNSFEMVNTIIIRYYGDNLKQVLAETDRIFQKFDPGYAISYTLIDDFCKSKYKKEEESSELLSYASLISLILAILGLYALSLFMVQKRTKEIGIRKVNGASEWQITSLLFSTFSKWLGIAFVIAVPISYFIMNNWLQQFAYHIEIGPLPFIIAGIVTGLFALITVGRQTWKAANQNPIESLRYE